jgi:galactitol-specific phosphotransferase system IIC component
MAEGNVMQMVGAFIGIAIMLGIGIQILGNAVQDCSTLPDFNATAGATQTGWAEQCETTNTSSQSAYALLVIILIVVAAVAILFVVRML